MNLKLKHLLPVIAVFSSTCQAIDWLLEPDFKASERYADNLTMQANPASVISSMITTISPGILLGYQAENNALKTHFNWNELIYHNAPSFNFSEKILDVNHQYQGERFTTGIAGAYYEQSSINTQLVDPTLNTTGQRLIPRYTRSISPNVRFLLTEKNSLQFDYSYQDVTFDRPAGLETLRYSDYTNQQFSATFTHAYSERLSFNLVGAYSLFDSSVAYPSYQQFENGVIFSSNGFIEGSLANPTNRSITTTYDQKSKNFFYQAGLQYAFDELTQLSLSAGMRFTDNKTRNQITVIYDPEYPGVFETNNPDTEMINKTKENDLSSKANGHVFSADLSRKGEWGYFSLNANQQLNPSSSGSQAQTTSFAATAHYNLTERWSAGLIANYRISDYTNVFNNLNTRYNSTYTTVSPRIRWDWTPEINLELSYTYAQREYTSSHQTSIGNNVQVQFSYQPQINRQVK